MISAQFYIGARRGNIASCVKPGGTDPEGARNILCGCSGGALNLVAEPEARRSVASIWTRRGTGASRGLEAEKEPRASRAGASVAAAAGGAQAVWQREPRGREARAVGRVRLQPTRLRG